MVFLMYNATMHNGEQWVKPERLKRFRENQKKKDNRPPEHLRTRQRGDVREDGMVFSRYSRDARNGEHWITQEHFNEQSKRLTEYYREYSALKRNDSTMRLLECQSTRVRHALKGNTKHHRSVEMLGCNAKELKNYLASKFTDGMTWENYGRNGWHVDHIRPCSSFDLSDPEQQKQCFHYTNLQPLWAKDNLHKGNKYNNN
jgi:hypothetical protein